MRQDDGRAAGGRPPRPLGLPRSRLVLRQAAERGDQPVAGGGARAKPGRAARRRRGGRRLRRRGLRHRRRGDHLPVHARPVRGRLCPQRHQPPLCGPACPDRGRPAAGPGSHDRTRACGGAGRCRGRRGPLDSVREPWCRRRVTGWTSAGAARARSPRRSTADCAPANFDSRPMVRNRRRRAAAWSCCAPGPCRRSAAGTCRTSRLPPRTSRSTWNSTACRRTAGRRRSPYSARSPC